MRIQRVTSRVRTRSQFEIETRSNLSRSGYQAAGVLLRQESMACAWLHARTDAACAGYIFDISAHATFWNFRRSSNFFTGVTSQFTAFYPACFGTAHSHCRQMEQAPASTDIVPLPIGSPIISLAIDSDADVQMRSTDIAANSSTVTVGQHIAHHFDEFRRYKQSSMANAAHRYRVMATGSASVLDTTSSSVTDITPAPVPVSGFRATLHCCRTCKILLPATSFYPSNLKRFTFYCKTCCVAKKHASTRKTRLITGVAAASTSTLPDTRAPDVSLPDTTAGAHRYHGAEHDSDPAALAGPTIAADTCTALKMLNRLRRMCARPSECGFRLVLPSPVSLDFDVKVARQLLLWWNATSALGFTTEEDHELRFVPWLLQHRSDSTQPLQPWEVIPVTRMQARRLTSTPPHLWMQLLDPAASAHIMTKSAELKRIISGHASPPI